MHRFHIFSNQSHLRHLRSLSYPKGHRERVQRLQGWAGVASLSLEWEWRLLETLCTFTPPCHCDLTSCRTNPSRWGKYQSSQIQSLYPGASHMKQRKWFSQARCQAVLPQETPGLLKPLSRPSLLSPESCHVSPFRSPGSPQLHLARRPGPVQKLPDSTVSPGCQLSAPACIPRPLEVLFLLPEVLLAPETLGILILRYWSQDH